MGDGISLEQMYPYIKPEAAKVWELYTAGSVRTIYYRDDVPGAILILEVADAIEASEIVKTLPLVNNDLLAVEIIPLKPYTGLEQLFTK